MAGFPAPALCIRSLHHSQCGLRVACEFPDALEALVIKWFVFGLWRSLASALAWGAWPPNFPSCHRRPVPRRSHALLDSLLGNNLVFQGREEALRVLANQL
jgi:hypothetical protein